MLARPAARPMRVPLPLLAALLAGCVAAPALPSPAAAGPYRFSAPEPVSKSYPGGEPVIAIASDGTLYVEGVGAGTNGNQNKVSRSADDGRTWSDVTPPAVGQERSNDGFVVVGNGDSVYAANVFELTFQVFRSDDKGASWTPLPVPRLPALMHRHWIVPVGASTLQVVVEALPPGFAPYLAGQRPSQDVTGTPNEGMWYFRSDDKGETWSVPQHIDPDVNFAGQGNLVVSKDGKSLYVPRYEEQSKFAPTYTSGRWYLLSSHDGGATWKRTEMFPLTRELSSAVESLSMDDAGTLFFVWSQQVGAQSRVEYSFSKDQGASWSTPRAVPGDSGTDAMAWGRARGEGNLSLMWFTADANGTASKVNASWRIAYDQLQGADTDAPIGPGIQIVTPDSVHEGNICARGPACGPGEDRRLLDYPWMDFTTDGRAHLVFPTTDGNNPAAHAFVAVQQP
jgi:hypothetical protein